MATPSLDGILSHSSIAYEGIVRPEKIIRLFDKAHVSSDDSVPHTEEVQIIKEYVADVYSLFMRTLSQYMAEHDSVPDKEVKLAALLQEIIKMKRIMRDHHIIQL